MATIDTYLIFNGNCEEAFTFYKTVFGGEFASIGKFKDMPENPEFPVSEDDKEKIMHVSYPIDEHTVLMGSDTGGEWASKFQQGNNFSLSVNAASKEEADRLFKELSAGGKIIMPMNNTFWGSYFGNFIDQFGISWMISFSQESE